MPTQAHSSALSFDSVLAMLSPTFRPSSHRTILGPMIDHRFTAPASFNREILVAAVRRVAVWSERHAWDDPSASIVAIIYENRL